MTIFTVQHLQNVNPYAWVGGRRVHWLYEVRERIWVSDFFKSNLPINSHFQPHITPQMYLSLSMVCLPPCRFKTQPLCSAKSASKVSLTSVALAGFFKSNAILVLLGFLVMKKEINRLLSISCLTLVTVITFYKMPCAISRDDVSQPLEVFKQRMDNHSRGMLTGSCLIGIRRSFHPILGLPLWLGW